MTLFTQLKYSNVLQVRLRVVVSLSAAYVVLHGTRENLLDQFFSPQRNRERKHDDFKLLHSNNILCLQEVHWKDEFLKALQVLAPGLQFFGTFIPGNENAGGSAICIHKDLLPDEVTVTHIATCQGRDYIVSIRSERTNLVIVNVHFEAELTVGYVYVKDYASSSHIGRHIPMLWASSWVTSISATPKKEDSTW